LAVDNSANPVWLGITNVAVLPVGSGQYVVSNITGQVFVPKTPEAFTYDADGNLTSNGRRTCTWDAGNRSVKLESRSDPRVGSCPTRQWALAAYAACRG